MERVFLYIVKDDSNLSAPIKVSQPFIVEQDRNETGVLRPFYVPEVSIVKRWQSTNKNFVSAIIG